MILGKWSDKILAPRVLSMAMELDGSIVRHGGRNIIRVSKGYNSLRYRDRIIRHRRAYRERWDALLRGNNGGALPSRRLVMTDGWVRDDTGRLPHLDALLDQADAIIAERAGRTYSNIQQPFLRNMAFPGDLEKYPALLDFILSSDVLDIAAGHLGTVPVLSKTRPSGLRLMESNASLDPGDNGPFRNSQLFHLDLHDTPLVYVLILARDVPADGGPWHFLPQGASDRASRGLGYRRRGAPYRVSDDEMYRHVARDETVAFTGKKGDVLFIDSSRCFHYGSRHAVVPRFQIMYGLTTSCRADLSQVFMKEIRYPASGSDSELRKMVLEPQSGF